MRGICSLFIFISLIVDVSAQKKALNPKGEISETLNGTDIIIEYYQPSVRGRKIMGELVPYGKVWQTGANNATKLILKQDARIEGETLAAGTYALFTIPGEKEWVIIFNKEAEQWGSAKYNQEEDALRVVVDTIKLNDLVETFSIGFTDSGIKLAWEYTAVVFNID